MEKEKKNLLELIKRFEEFNINPLAYLKEFILTYNLLSLKDINKIKELILNVLEDLNVDYISEYKEIVVLMLFGFEYNNSEAFEFLLGKQIKEIEKNGISLSLRYDYLSLDEINSLINIATLESLKENVEFIKLKSTSNIVNMVSDYVCLYLNEVDLAYSKGTDIGDNNFVQCKSLDLKYESLNIVEFLDLIERPIKDKCLLDAIIYLMSLNKDNLDDIIEQLMNSVNYKEDLIRLLSVEKDIETAERVLVNLIARDKNILHGDKNSIEKIAEFYMQEGYFDYLDSECRIYLIEKASRGLLDNSIKLLKNRKKKKVSHLRLV